MYWSIEIGEKISGSLTLAPCEFWDVRYLSSHARRQTGCCPFEDFFEKQNQKQKQIEDRQPASSAECASNKSLIRLAEEMVQFFQPIIEHIEADRKPLWTILNNYSRVGLLHRIWMNPVRSQMCP